MTVILISIYETSDLSSALVLVSEKTDPCGKWVMYAREAYVKQ